MKHTLFSQKVVWKTEESLTLQGTPNIPGQISESQIRAIVKAASLAPSGDNCQPWCFHWDGRELVVTHDEERDRHALNRAHHGSLVSLGCVLESIRIAALHEGLSVKWTVVFNPLSAQLSFS